jgi:hypothetical protein
MASTVVLVSRLQLQAPLWGVVVVALVLPITALVVARQQTAEEMLVPLTELQIKVAGVAVARLTQTQRVPVLAVPVL